MPSLLRAGLWIAVGVALGRVAGLVREAVLAARFGLGDEADVAVLLLTLPDALMNVLVGGALAGILVPRLAGLERSAGERLVAQVSLASFIGGIVLALALMTPATLHVLAPGLSPAAAAVAQQWLPLALASLPLAAVTAVQAAALQARERFAAASLGTLAVNAAVIAAVLIAPGLMPLAVGVLLGSALRLALVTGDWAAQGPRWSPAGGWLADRTLWAGYARLAAAGAVILVVPLVGRALASQAGPGAIAAYTYALKLFELPLGLVLTVFGVVLFPRLARLRAASDPEAATTFAGGMQAVAVAGTACALVVGVFAHDLAALAFGRGRMDAAAVTQVADLARILALALPAAGVASLLQAWATAGQDTRSPLIAGVLGLLLFVALALILPGIAGLAWATVGLHAAMAVGLWLRLERPAMGDVARGMGAALVGALPGLALSVAAEGSILLRLLAAAVAGAGAVLCGALACPAIRTLRRP